MTGVCFKMEHSVNSSNIPTSHKKKLPGLHIQSIHLFLLCLGSSSSWTSATRAAIVFEPPRSIPIRVFLNPCWKLNRMPPPWHGDRRSRVVASPRSLNPGAASRRTRFRTRLRNADKAVCRLSIHARLPERIPDSSQSQTLGTSVRATRISIQRVYIHLQSLSIGDIKWHLCLPGFRQLLK